MIIQCAACTHTVPEAPVQLQVTHFLRHWFTAHVEVTNGSIFCLTRCPVRGCHVSPEGTNKYSRHRIIVHVLAKHVYQNGMGQSTPLGKLYSRNKDTSNIARMLESLMPDFRGAPYRKLRTDFSASHGTVMHPENPRSHISPSKMSFVNDRDGAVSGKVFPEVVGSPCLILQALQAGCCSGFDTLVHIATCASCKRI